MKEGCAYEVASVKEFQNTLSQIDKNLHAEKVKNAQFIERFRGAVNKVIENINV